MAWTKARAEARIRGWMNTAPQVKVERYADQYLPRAKAARELAARVGATAAASRLPLQELPDGEAVLVDTVQVYIRALNYDDVRLDHGRETEASHARGLSFLDLLYHSADRVVAKTGGQRVDYHGARLHAVVIDPAGAEGLDDRIATALALAEEMMGLARVAGAAFLPGMGLKLRFRVGIDVGPCVAINSGRRDEREPMFIGPAANHAAKLAAGDAEGIYLSDQIRAHFGLRRALTLNEEKAAPAVTAELDAMRRCLTGVRDSNLLTSQRLKDWRTDLALQRDAIVGPEGFSFHQHTPPLRSISYEELMPSRSIRMQLVSLFADIDGYTAYIDRAMASGRLAEAVRLLHIVRSEFNAVMQDDFNGRKLRFIGDAIHGLLADGTSRETDLEASVSLAARCAGALRSSFELCQEMVPGGRELGLAIGFELGVTPVSRIGIRGGRSVRVASSLTVRAAEACERECRGTETMIGEGAYAAAPPALRKMFGPGRKVTNLTYDDVVVAIDARRVAAVVAGTGAAVFSPQPARAYAR